MLYNLISSIIILIAGVALLFFREKFVDLQKKRASTKSDFISQRITQQPRSSAILVATIVGIGFILGAFINLIRLFY